MASHYQPVHTLNYCESAFISRNFPGRAIIEMPPKKRIPRKESDPPLWCVGMCSIVCVLRSSLNFLHFEVVVHPIYSRMANDDIICMSLYAYTYIIYVE